MVVMSALIIKKIITVNVNRLKTVTYRINDLVNLHFRNANRLSIHFPELWYIQEVSLKNADEYMSQSH